ncbi:GSCOCG00010502001-RA-CDS [Cotesia congregata]|nr:GSCOCG00010502001-RA-CDS [Cotesia congregata]
MEEVIVAKTRNKNLSSRKELELLDKQELIDRILQLEAHTVQLKNIIKKSDGVKYDKKQGKVFDFNQ